MSVITSLLFNFIMIVTVPIWVTVGLLLFPIPYKWRFLYFTQWSNLMIWLLKVLCNLRYEVEGRENIPKRAAILFSKHQSMWETIALQQLFRPQVWVFKKELLWTPFFGWALLELEAISIDRKSGHKAVRQIVAKGTQRLRSGKWVVIFPEGTRVAPGQRKRYGIGGAVLAEQSQFPVIPVAHNAGEYWRRRALVKKPGVIRVVIGKPIDTKGRTAQEINRLAEEWIESTMDRITTLKEDNKPMAQELS